jgi:NAD(P)-dependent dehydrogenase (short-subunit alcohol dehydrogenase family)
MAAKAGVVALMKLTALRLGQYSIRSNTVHPTGETFLVDAGYSVS